MRVVAAVLAGGRGERFGGDKNAASLGGKPVWRWSFETFLRHPDVHAVGLVGSARNLDAIRESAPEAAFVLQGGEDRQESSLVATRAADGDVVLLHDAARPFVDEALISRVIAGIERTHAAAPAIPAADTLRTMTDGGYRLVDRTKTVCMQSPQGGLRDLLLHAHGKASGRYTDEMALIEAIHGPYELVEGDSRNFKITTTSDLERARSMMERMETRTGFGYDIHPFSADPQRRLILGGVAFPESPGLHGHSDADVAIHAIVDAILGAVALGDIGTHFPNDDPQWKDASSLVFLRHAVAQAAEAGWEVVNVDVTLVGEKPKVMPRAGEIRERLAAELRVDRSQVGFKATTNEGLGALGRGEGIAAYAVATLRRLTS